MNEDEYSSSELVDDLIEKGIARFDEGKYSKAIEFYDDALKIKSDDWRIWNNKGNALRHLGKLKEAMQCFDVSIELNPNEPHPWHGKANIALDAGRKMEGLSYYNKCLQLIPEDELKSTILSEKGALLASLGAEKEGDECFKLALALNPKNPIVLINRAIFYYYLHDSKKFHEYYKRSLELFPKDQHDKMKKNVEKIIEEINESK